MDRITTSLLNEFTKDFELGDLAEDRRFEHLSAYVTIRRHYSEAFETSDVVIGSGSDTGIDAIAVIVNGVLVADVDEFIGLADATTTLDVSFVFIQAERKVGFSAAKIGTFGFGVQDFFSEEPKLARNDDVIKYSEIMEEIYERSSKFKKSKPSCHLYYVTAGNWADDNDPEVRRRAIVSDLKKLGLFSVVEFLPVGADELAKMYGATMNAISRTVQFVNRVELPEIEGVKEAFLGYLPTSEFVNLVRGDDGEILRTIFYDNVRDWQEYNPVNDEMRETLISENSHRFVIMNNGVTIIAKELQRVGAKFTLDDFQIVNGCQTSHVLFHQFEDIDPKITVPLRLIVTQDEDVIEDIIKATNRQTQLKDEQFLALTKFARKIELFFQSFVSADQKLYYERRSNQFSRQDIEKTRIVTPPNLIRAFAAIYRNEPHRTTRNFRSLLDSIGSDIMSDEHKLEPYYAASFALYRLEYLFRTQKIPPNFKPARFHLLLAARLLHDKVLPPLNSNAIAKSGMDFVELLWDPKKADDLFARAANAVGTVAMGNFHRDNIRTQPFTEQLIALCCGH